ncbi:hypothetical protein C8R46DRAFT_1196518 [Mycena filopes]|nr:hypothetical protein C8R46DRAFT_1196518 [Mycena filopes]
MPYPHTTAKSRVDSITAYLTPALTLLDDLNDAFGLSYAQPIIKTTYALIAGLQNVKRNKDECFQLVESIHQILYPIIQLHLRSDTLGPSPLVVLDTIGEFTETLHKIYMFIQIQQDGNKIKQFFHQAQANKLLKDCQARLDQAIEVFKVQAEVDNMHKELLELISAMSDTDGTMSDRSSFSLSKEILAQEAPRIAILGGGGMGKTSLARAALHHGETCSKFQARFFVSAEAATTAIELAALIGLHLGLNPGSNLIRPVVRYFAQQTSPCLLVLDNLETPWEPITKTGRN